MTDYCTSTQVQQTMNRTSAFSAAEGAVVARLITAASEEIDRLCKRPDGFVAAALASQRLYRGSGERWQRIDECIAITAVAVKTSPTDATYEAWAATDWLAACGGPKEPNYNKLPYNLLLVDPAGSYSRFTSGRYGAPRGFRPDSDYEAAGLPTVQVTARWGYGATAPAVVTNAAVIQTIRWFKRGEGAFGDALMNPELGTILFKKALDPDIQLSLHEAGLIKTAV